MVRVWVVLVGVLAACHHGAASPSTVAPRPTAVPTADLLSFLPADAEIVIGFDAKALRAGAVWAEYGPQLLATAGPALPVVTRDCGFDPVTALESVVLGVRNPDRDGAVLVVRGYDRELASRCLIAHPLLDSKTTLDGTVLVSTYSNGSVDFTAFADQRTAVAVSGHGSTRQQLAAAMARGAPLRKSRSMAGMLDTLPPGAAAWFVIDSAAGSLDKLAGLGSRPLGVSGALRLASGVSFKGQARFASPRLATQFAAALDARLAMARGAVDEISVRADGSMVTLALEISLTQLRALVVQFTPMWKIWAQSRDSAPTGQDGGDDQAGDDEDAGDEDRD